MHHHRKAAADIATMATTEFPSPSSPLPPLSTASPESTEFSNSSPVTGCPSSGSPSDGQELRVAAYESYVRWPELSTLWSRKDFPDWNDESIVKPALQGLEITFRSISIALSDPRRHANRRQWERKLQSLAGRQIEIVADLLAGTGHSAGGPPFADLSATQGVLTRQSSSEVWKLPGTIPAVVSRTSEASLLPRLAVWDKSQDIAGSILYQIESHFRQSGNAACPFTLGLGEPNLAGKPILEYDLIVRPLELHALRRSPAATGKANYEGEALFTIHQILESWLRAAEELLARLRSRIDAREWPDAAGDCWVLESIWKLLMELEDLHLLMDPDDFLRLKSQLAIRATAPDGSDAFCFRSSALMRVTAASKDLRNKVPEILEVAVDPAGGPRVQDAAMRLYQSKSRGEGANRGKVDLLQGFQAIEAAVKRFFFAYRQVVAAVMGSLEAGGNRALFLPTESLDSLSSMFLEPSYFPSLDAAKTFLGDAFQKHLNPSSGADVSAAEPAAHAQL